MSFVDAIQSALSQYAVFRGRASRSQFWWFMLFCVLAVTLAEAIVGEGFSGLVTLALVLPTLALTARRLHDIGRSGWWQLIVWVPVVGVFVSLYWYVQPSEPMKNKWGPAVGTPQEFPFDSD